MRWLILSTIAALLAAGTATAAENTNAALCRPIEQEWNSVGRGTNVGAMEREIAKIPKLCSGVRAQAQRRLAELKGENGARSRAAQADAAQQRALRAAQTDAAREQAEAEAAKAEAERELAAAEAAKAEAERERAAAAPVAQSLPTTLNAIRDQIAQQGLLSFVAYWHNSADNTNGAYQMTLEASAVTSYPDYCIVNWHWHTTRDAQVIFDGAAGIPLKLVTVVQVVSMGESIDKINVAAGYTTTTATTQPVYWAVGAQRTDGPASWITLRDRTTADQVAALIRDAARGCQGG
jgi:hypothetical protein